MRETFEPGCSISTVARQHDVHANQVLKWCKLYQEGIRRFARVIGLEPVTTPVCSPQSNGMAESFVRMLTRDYIAFMPKPDGKTALANLA